MMNPSPVKDIINEIIMDQGNSATDSDSDDGLYTQYLNE